MRSGSRFPGSDLSGLLVVLLMIGSSLMMPGGALEDGDGSGGEGDGFVEDDGGHLGLSAGPGVVDDDPRRWLTNGLKNRLLEGEQVSIDEIPGFPYSSEDLEACGQDCPALPYTMIRPGAALGVSQLACTANFVFRGGGDLGIGTAGHCTSVGDGHSTLIVSDGLLSLVEFGRTVFSTGNGGIGNDFALILIDPLLHDRVHPAVSVVDGPCGFRGSNGFADPIQYYGHAFAWGAGGQPRSGFVLFDGGSSLQYTRFHSGGGGDSGSPVVFVAQGTDVRAAAAVHTHGFTLGVGLPIGFGTSMPRVFEILQQAGWDDWELVDSPNCL